MQFENHKTTELTLGLPGEEIKPMSTSSYLKRSLDDSETNQPPSKLQIVGWPPLPSYEVYNKEADARLVKVNMAGAPYLRKIDITMYKGYKELIKALETMFKSFNLSKEESKELSLNNVAYEDKEGDLMLVGDLPWNTFLSSCKKLRIMKK